MKDIRIFVASSKELVAERNQLSYLVLAMEDEFEKRGLRVRLSKWEYVDPTMTEARTEDRYLEEMLDCDGVLMLFRRVLGMYTKEEVDKAIAAETAGSSRIKRHLMLFKEGDGEPTLELAKWRATLSVGTYGTFADMDGLKAHFLRFVEELSGLTLQDVATTEDRTVSAFLAADGELATDRNAFADAVLNLNDVLVRRGVRVRLRFYDPERHGELLDRSEMALVLYHTRCGEFGPEALKESFVRSKGNENPRRLYVFFRDADGRPLDGAFAAFRDGFAEAFGSAPCRFENVDTLSLNFLFSVESVLGDNGGTFVKLDGRMVMADGQEVGDLTKLPMLRKNAGLAALLGKMDDVSARFSAQREKCEQAPQDDGLYVELLDISAEKNRLQDQIDRELRQSFNLAKRMAAVSIAQVDATVARARELMEEGKVKEALEVLDGASSALKRRRLLRRAADRSAAEELEIKELKAGCDIEYFRVDAVMAYTELSFKERFAKAESIYKSLVADVEEYAANCTVGHKADLDRHLAGILRRFAKLYDEVADSKSPIPLLEQANQIYQSIEAVRHGSTLGVQSAVYRSLAYYNRVNDDLDCALDQYRIALQLLGDKKSAESSKAACYYGMAVIHKRRDRIAEAESAYSKAHDLYRSAGLKWNEARVLSSWGNLKAQLDQLDAAERMYLESLTIRQQYAEKDHDKYDDDVADSISALAVLHSNTSRKDVADGEYRQVVAIRRRYAEENPAKYNASLAAALGSYGHYNARLSRLDEAEQLWLEALDIRRKLSLANPSRYQSAYASSVLDIAKLYHFTNRHKDAERCYQLALELFKTLSEKKPDVYEPRAADVLSRFAMLYDWLHQREKALELYGERVTLLRKLVVKVPSKYRAVLADALKFLANLLRNMDRFKEAEANYREAVGIIRQLAEENPKKYCGDVDAYLRGLGLVLEEQGKLVEAESLYVEALDISRQDAENTAKLSKDKGDVALALMSLASVHKRQGKFNESEGEYKEAIVLLRELAEINHTAYDNWLADGLYRFGKLYFQMKMFGDARILYQEALTLQEQLVQRAPARFQKDLQKTKDALALLQGTEG